LKERTTPERLEGGRETPVARQRYELYKLANEQLKAAYEAGFFIECVSICESIIADRLEARIQYLQRGTDKPSNLDALGRLLKQLDALEDGSQMELTAAYQSIREWTKARNETIHQFVKVTSQNEHLDGTQRLKQSKLTAQQGVVLMRKISSLVRKYNDWKS